MGDRPQRVCVLAGGFGGAKLSHGFALASAGRSDDVPSIELSVIVNTGDDLELHGLTVSPDLDTVMYTLAGLANNETGWGVRDETWSAAGMLERYGAETWFRLGDRDLATHLARTAALRSGQRLTDVTAHLAVALGVQAHLLPMADEPVRTRIRTRDGWLDFQDYFVRRHQQDDVLEIRHEGAESARPTVDVLQAIGSADLIVFAPSNPYVSIGTILAVPGMADAIRGGGAPVIAVSPIVAGQALRGPADRMLETLGGEASARGVAALYAARYPGLVDRWVIDEADAEMAQAIRDLGCGVLVAATVMRSDEDRRALAETVLRDALPA